MVEFTLADMDEAFMIKIPSQRAKVNEMMEQDLKMDAVY